MNEKFGFDEIKSEDEVFDYYVNKEFVDDSLIEEFEFLEDLEVENLYEEKEEDDYYLLFRKRKDNLNSQFGVDNYLYINPDCDFNEDDEVIASSSYGEANFIIKHDADIKKRLYCIICWK